MKDERRLTPVQRLRQAEPSWLRSGQTTALFSSDTEKDPVSEALGGIPTAACTLAGRARWEEGCDAGRGALMRVGSSTGSLRSLGSSESFDSECAGGGTDTKQALLGGWSWCWPSLFADNNGREGHQVGESLSLGISLIRR